ncbi:MAG: translation initiation factor IF-3 [Chloroflexi bacterium]|nr:translation initiation factor IF-3 [Chloroflexota bacterium]
MLDSRKRSLISDEHFRINQQIRAKEIRVIDDAGKQVGVIPTHEALRLAQDRNLDLVEVAPNAQPPVCRIIDFGKFMYERTKKEREAKKGQKAIEIKELRIRPKTNWYHTSFKLKRVREFLKAGNKIRVRVLFRAREITHLAIGREILEKVAVELADEANIEQAPLMDGKSLVKIGRPGPTKGGPEAARAVVRGARVAAARPQEPATAAPPLTR